VFGEFGLLELCRLNLFKFRIKVLKTKRKYNSPPSWIIDPYTCEFDIDATPREIAKEESILA
jgi:hypothetical protein